MEAGEQCDDGNVDDHLDHDHHHEYLGGDDAASGAGQLA
jgi:hypothetical protein